MVGMVVFGVVLLGAGLLARSGVWRTWSDNGFYASVGFHAAPGGGVFALAASAGLLLPRPLSLVVTFLGLVCALTGIVLAAISSEKLTPAWYRQRQHTIRHRDHDTPA